MWWREATTQGQGGVSPSVAVADAVQSSCVLRESGVYIVLQ